MSKVSKPLFHLCLLREQRDQGGHTLTLTGQGVRAGETLTLLNENPLATVLRKEGVSLF